MALGVGHSLYQSTWPWHVFISSFRQFPLVPPVQERILKPSDLLASLGDGNQIIQVVTWPFNYLYLPWFMFFKTKVPGLSIKTWLIFYVHSHFLWFSNQPVNTMHGGDDRLWITFPTYWGFGWIYHSPWNGNSHEATTKNQEFSMWHSRHFMSKKMACRSIRQLWICSLDVSFPFVPAKMVQKLVYLSFHTVMIFVMPCGFPCGFPWKHDVPMGRWCDVIPFDSHRNWNGRIFGEQDASFSCFSAVFLSVFFGLCWILLDSVGFLPFWCSFYILPIGGFSSIFDHARDQPCGCFASALGRKSDPPLSPEFFVIKSSHSLKKDTRVARVGISSVC